MENVGVVGLNEYTCWLSQAMKADLSFLFPSACSPIDVEESQTMEGIASLMRKCWWMHGQGDKDIITAKTTLGKGYEKVISWKDLSSTCYLFTPKEDIHLTKLEEYLHTYDRVGNVVRRDSQSSTWYYIQKEDREERGICFDKRFLEKEEEKLQKGKRYFIIFYDDRSPLSNGERDKILITRDPDFGKDQTGFLAWVKEKVGKLVSIWGWCYDPEEAQTEEAEGSKAATFFNNLVTILKECSKVTLDKECQCGSKLDTLPFGYSVKFEKIEEKKYKLSLLKEGKLYEENGKNFTGEVGGRIGFWRDRMEEALEKSCFPGIIKERQPKMESDLTNYYVAYHPNSGREGCKDNAGIYLMTEFRGWKTCQVLSAEIEEAKAKAEQKKLCEGYEKESECLDNLAKCYPAYEIIGSKVYFPPNSCKYCEDDFECSDLEYQKACDLNPCGKTCKWDDTRKCYNE